MNMNKQKNTVLAFSSPEKNLYAGVRGIAVKILNRIDRTDAYLDKMLQVEMRNSDLSGLDKSLLYEIVHGVIRWLGRIDWILNGFYRGQFSKCIPNLKNAMRVALYQIMFMDKVPDFAAVNEAVEFVKKLQGQKTADLTNAVLRNIIRKKEAIKYPDTDDGKANYFSAYYSHPSWLVKRWIKRYGEDFTEELLKSNNTKPFLTIRINNLVTNKTELKQLLNSVNLSHSDTKYLPNFIKMYKLTNITDWEYFKKGYFGIQDESTGFPCKLLDVKPGMKVLDFCAAPGGKTALLSEYMNNEGELVALDKYESRLKMLQNNLKRLHVKNVRAVVADALEFEENNFDRILVDVPCTGLGTLKKKPDIKWKRDIGDFRRLNVTQSQLLAKAAALLKPGGVLVYSTCTIEPEENYEIINKFLEENPSYGLLNAEETLDKKVVDEHGCVQTMPNVHNIDGAFSAKLIRNR